jgi:hypothetical protein
MTTAETSGGSPRSASGFVGALDQTPLAEVFQRIVRKGKSGDLKVTVPGAVKTVYFDRGFVVFAASDLTSDRLGESMIEAGRISRHEFALASMVMKASKRRFGETLVEAGIVSEEELGQYVASQVNRIILSLFPTKTGRYSFEEHPCTIPVGLMVSLSVYRILLEGVRRMTSQKLVIAGLPPFETRFRVAPEPPFTLDTQKLHPVERAVLSSAGQGASLSQIVEGVGGHKGVALRAAYSLLSAGLLEAVESQIPGGARPRVQEETGTFVLSEIRQKVESRQEAPVPVPPVETSKTPLVEPAPEPPAELSAEEEPARPEDHGAAAHTAMKPPIGIADVSDSSPNFLSRLGESMKRRWTPVENALLRWVGSTAQDASEAPAEMHPTPEPPKPPVQREAPRERRPAPDRVARHPKPAAPVRKDAEGEDDPVWFIESAPEEVARDTGALDVGVPSWSIQDSPAEVEPEEPGLTARTLGVPSWSMKDDPEPSAEASRDVHGESVHPVEPMASLDHELFIEGDLPGGEESSLLRQIPVEEIALNEEAPEVESEAFAEFSEVEPLAALVEEPAPPAPPEPPVALVPEVPVVPVTPRMPVMPVMPVMNDARPPASGTPREREEAHPEPAHASAGAEESSRDQAPATHEDEMRRMRQGGGEARLLRDVKLHFKLQDWEGAVPLLEQLLRISPGSALYRGMLARALSRHPVRRKDAEEHFIEALRLSPQDAELHYWLGLYYKSFGLKARAVTEFRTTLRLDPKHEGARKQLAGDRKDDAVGAVIKKIFG